MNQTLLQVTDLKVRIGSGASAIRPVDGLNFQIQRGETFALLGESGCGKSMTALALLQLLPQPAGEITHTGGFLPVNLAPIRTKGQGSNTVSACHDPGLASHCSRMDDARASSEISIHSVSLWA